MEFPTPKYCFKILIDGLICAEFSQVSGMEQNDNSIEYRGVNSQTVRLPFLKFIAIKLIRGTSSNKKFIDWIIASNPNLDARKNISIVLFDGDSSSTNAVWELTAAWPVKYIVADQEVDVNVTAFDSIELAHEGVHRIQ